ncbi:MAG: glycosyltransferase [Thermoplasmatota archaeon]|nr:glycosyltransferase [Candidatus Thermoplasmatota archaeon]MBU1914841.1 glycosyltransferase [Candidatus Thermoplasmatota archaeon]
MKIAMFVDSFHPTVDGAVVAMEIAAGGLEKRGHEVIVLAPEVNPIPVTTRPVHYLPSIEFKSYPGYRVVISPSDMLEHLRRERVDIIHSHGIASMAILSLTAARALKLPHVLTFHTMANEAMKYYSPIGINSEIMQKMVWIYLRNLLKRPEIVIAPSAPIKEELEMNGVRMKSCEVVPTGVDCTRFTPERYDKGFLGKYGLAGMRVLLHVGRLSPEKRFDIVLKAVAELGQREPELRLLVVGKGPSADEYKRMAKDLGIKDKVVFAGFLPDDELPVAYASCEALVIASTFETQGLVVLEALASGTPVAGIRYRAIPEFVREGKNGCLFELDTCADAIRRCLRRSESMMLDAVASAREYSVEACTARLEKAYDHAVEILKSMG